MGVAVGVGVGTGVSVGIGVSVGTGVGVASIGALHASVRAMMISTSERNPLSMHGGVLS